MKTGTMIVIAIGAAAAYVVWRGRATAAPAAVNAGTVAPPVVGAPVVPAPAVNQLGSETAYATVKTDAGVIEKSVASLQAALDAAMRAMQESVRA